jgi:hypothetical protein
MRVEDRVERHRFLTADAIGCRCLLIDHPIPVRPAPPLRGASCRRWRLPPRGMSSEPLGVEAGRRRMGARRGAAFTLRGGGRNQKSRQKHREIPPRKSANVRMRPELSLFEVGPNVRRTVEASRGFFGPSGLRSFSPFNMRSHHISGRCVSSPACCCRSVSAFASREVVGS